MASDPDKAKSDEIILVYARIRPPAKKKAHRHGTGKYEVIDNDDLDNKGSNNIDLLHLSVPKKDDRIGGYIDNTVEKYQFQYHKVFTMKAKQNDVFYEMAVPIIKNTLSGYNGTIFAYGQTGSGKTFTMTGGTSNYDDRGLIPRTISYIFNECDNDNENNYKVTTFRNLKFRCF